MTNARICQAAIGITGMAAVALVNATPAAQADVTNNGLTVSGNTFTVGQSYRLTVTDPNAPAGTHAFFDDNNVGVPIVYAGNQEVAAPAPLFGNGTATQCWTPTTAGVHHIDVEALTAGSTIFVPLGAVDITVAAAPASTSSAALTTSLSAGVISYIIAPGAIRPGTQSAGSLLPLSAEIC